MGRISAVRECLQRATCALCRATADTAAVGPAAVCAETPEPGRGALHGHG